MHGPEERVPLAAVRATLAADYLQLVDPDRVSNPHGWGWLAGCAGACFLGAPCLARLYMQFLAGGSTAPAGPLGPANLSAGCPGCAAHSPARAQVLPTRIITTKISTRISTRCAACREHALEAYRLLDPAAAAATAPAGEAVDPTAERGGQTAGAELAE